jgi:hypothetical protein
MSYFAAFFFAAQYAFIRAACFFRCAALNVLVFLWPFSVGSTTASKGFFGGRPRRLAPCKASMARSNFSRSWIRSETICSVGTSRDDITASRARYVPTSHTHRKPEQGSKTIFNELHCLNESTLLEAIPR